MPLRGLLLVLLALGLLLPCICAAQDATEEVDYLALAGMLIRDDHLDRARVALSQVDSDDPNLDRVRYFTLLGIVHLRSGAFEQAYESLGLATAAGPHDALLYLYRAQAAYGCTRFSEALAELDKAKGAGIDTAGFHLLRAQTFRALNDSGRAWRAVEDGLLKYADDVNLLRLRVALLMESGLYQQALTYTGLLLTGEAERLDDVLTVAESLIRANQPEQAVTLLEAACLRHPDNLDLRVALAHAWQANSLPRAAATLFAEVARHRPEFAFEAAELYRRAGMPLTALYWNALVDDQKRKIRQRLGLLLQNEHYEMAAAMETRLSRLGLLEDEDIRYALAYALFKIRDYDRAEQHLKHLTRQDLFTNANSLRAAIETCRAEAWECY